MENKFELTLIEALCVMKCGWKTEKETESWTLLNKQEALNLANTIEMAIDDVEEFEKQRLAKKNK